MLTMTMVTIRRGVDHDYTRDDTKEVVRDNVTGLEWQDDTAAATVGKFWADAEPYCTSLPLDGGGWRLPTRSELVGIADYGRVDPAIDPVFLHTAASDSYWSSTTFASSTSVAWIVDFYDGNQDGYYETYNHYVRCVRAGD